MNCQQTLAEVSENIHLVSKKGDTRIAAQLKGSALQQVSLMRAPTQHLLKHTQASLCSSPTAYDPNHKDVTLKGAGICYRQVKRVDDSASKEGRT